LKTGNNASVAKVVGIVFVVVGMLLFYFAFPIIIRPDLFTAWILTWFVVSCIGIGFFLIVHEKARCSARSFLGALALLVPWSAILLIDLQNDMQILLAALIALSGVLFYKYYEQIGRSRVDVSKYNQPSKILWVFLIITVIMSVYFDFYLAVSYSLFVAYVATIPISLLIILEYSLVMRTDFKKYLEIWLSYIILTMIPWFAVFPVAYQILLVIIFLGSIILVAYYYHRKQKFHVSITT
jgi:hypothetical protein